MSNVDLSPVIKGILKVIENEEKLLAELPDTIITQKRNKQDRTIKQIVGHLVDSASNNLHRIIHLQYQPIPLFFPDYANHGNNDRWIAIQDYQTEDWNNLIQLWKYSNLHIAHIIGHVDHNKLNNEWITALGNKISLEKMIIDYLPHLHLHIDEIHELINA